MSAGADESVGYASTPHRPAAESFRGSAKRKTKYPRGGNVAMRANETTGCVLEGVVR